MVFESTANVLLSKVEQKPKTNCEVFLFKFCVFRATKRARERSEWKKKNVRSTSILMPLLYQKIGSLSVCFKYSVNVRNKNTNFGLCEG